MKVYLEQRTTIAGRYCPRHEAISSMRWRGWIQPLPSRVSGASHWYHPCSAPRQHRRCWRPVSVRDGMFLDGFFAGLPLHVFVSYLATGRSFYAVAPDFPRSRRDGKGLLRLCSVAGVFLFLRLTSSSGGSVCTVSSQGPLSSFERSASRVRPRALRSSSRRGTSGSSPRFSRPCPHARKAPLSLTAGTNPRTGGPSNPDPEVREAQLSTAPTQEPRDYLQVFFLVHF